jgi:carbon-monoxide dehydrogenase small subunit
MQTIDVRLNGQSIQDQVPDDRLLIDWLRDTRGLVGVHAGCDTAQCGACTVIIDGAAVKACNLLAFQVDGSEITTIEGVAAGTAVMHPLQQAFSQHHALQCGYCTPGMVMRALAIVDEAVPAEPDAIRNALSGNLCRCTGYEGIVDAIVSVLPALRADRDQTQ